MRKFLLLFLAVLATGSLFAQNRQVSGTVTDDRGEPVVGAVVSIQGQSGSAVITDARGRYSVNAPSNATLSFTFFGMETRSIALEGRRTLDVTMSFASTYLDDVVVTAFGESTREAFTGSAGEIDAEAISKRTSTNIVNSLGGQIAGVQIRNSDGQPGQEADIRIRGFTSLNAENNPLIIVDGAPFEGNLSSLNPMDIENFTTLKDASSTALYGARAANGVVMITTKRAKRGGDATISFDMKLGVGTRAAKDYDYITDPATHYELGYAQFYNFRIAGGYTPEDAAKNANTNLIDYLFRYNLYDTGDEALIVNGKLNPNAKLGNTVSTRYGDFYLYPDDWKKEAFKSSLRQEYNVAVNGGNELSSYYFSLGYLNDNGIVANSSFDRFTARFKGDFQAKKWLKIGGNVAYAHTKTSFASGYDEGGLSSVNVFAFTTRMAPIYPVYLRDGETKQILIDDRGMKMYDWGDGMAHSVANPDNATSRPFLGNANPLAAILLDDDSSAANMINMTGFAEATLTEGLKVNITGTNYIYEERGSMYTNPWYGQYASSQGSISKEHNRDMGVNLTETITYAKKIGDHNFDVLLGHENYVYRQTYLNGTKDHMFGTSVHELDNAINIIGAGSSAVNYNNEGYFARGQYDYASKYFASVSFRRDASSRFHPDNRWGNFWSIGGAWLMNKENFLSNADWIDMLKLKVSYGTVGNDKIGNFRYVDTFDVVASNDVASVVPKTRGNKDIAWETVGSFNVGAEFEFFDGRLAGSLEYYNRNTSDMLFLLPTPESSGFQNYYTNLGDMRNSGVELNLTGVAVRTKDLNLSFHANITTMKNKILSLPPEQITPGQNGFASGNYFMTEGGTIYDWYMPIYAGVDHETGEALYYKQVDGSPEDIHKNPTGNYTTTNDHSEATLYRQGTALPDFYGGFGTTFYFYGFDLSVNFDYQVGGLTYDAPYATAMRNSTSSDGQAFHKDLLNAWSVDNKDSNIPRIQFGDQYTSSRSNRFLTDASFLNLQNINLGYTLPSKLTSKMKLGSIRIYCSAENITYWSKRKGLDPRQNWDGSTANTNYSPIRTISGGLQVTF